MSLVVIIDYGMCNLDSIARAIEECGASPRVSSNCADLSQAERIVLPGVGSFAEAMSNIRSRGIDQALRQQVLQNRIPLLGICLGMQLLASRGTEGGCSDGLGFIEGTVTRLQPVGLDTRIPHIGWNEVHPQRSCSLLANLPSQRDFYFVHSYHFVCNNSDNIAAVTPYCGEFTSIVQRDWIWGTQFHPEKSQGAGFQVLRNFLAI